MPLIQMFLNLILSLVPFRKKETGRTVPISVKPAPVIKPPEPEKQLDIMWHPSSMYTIRPHRQITCIVLHHTANFNTEVAVNWLCNIEAKASVHYVIGLKGEMYQLVNDRDVAWHAGESEYRGVRYVNSYSLGIELVGDTTKKPITEEQYSSLILLVKYLMAKHNINKLNITDHKTVAIPPGRKVDLGDKFDWNRFFSDL